MSNTDTSIIFPGQGSQVVGMGKDFYENFSYVKEMFEKTNDILHRDLKKIIFEGDEELLKATNNSQPAIMLISAVILEILKRESGKSIEQLCNFVAGHSLGEYSALYACESINLEQAIQLLDVRGKSFAEIGQKSNGGMLALLGCSIENALEIIKKAKLDGEVLQVANDNTVGQVVLSGNINSIDKASEISKEYNVKKAVKLPVSGAFHSQLMEPAVEKMKEILSTIDIKEPKVNFIANYTAEITKGDKIKENLLNQITNGVRWRETMLNMEKNGVVNFIEITIEKNRFWSGFVSRSCPNAKSIVINSIDSIKEFINNNQ